MFLNFGRLEISVQTANINGQDLYKWLKDLFPINRSLTGKGVRETLEYLKSIIPNLEIREVKSGTKAFDWVVPKEWNLEEAYLIDENHKTIIHSKNSNLHVVGYSPPIDREISRVELESHLYSIPELPKAIPYVTSYYEENWGFCMSHEDRVKLTSGPFRAVIKSSLEPGVLNYGELCVPGSSKNEILLSTYICHPSMASNELSGPVIAAGLALWLESLENRKYTFRILFLPETIGSIVYLSENLKYLKNHVKAGWVLTCLGDNRNISFLPSKKGDTLADKVSRKVLKDLKQDWIEYSFLERGSDERQYCAPGVELPVCSIMRSKYGTYPEYHTSLDNLEFVSESSLHESYNLMKNTLQAVENDYLWVNKNYCEPNLGKRGLYPMISTRETNNKVKDLMNVLTYCDGSLSTVDIAEKCLLEFKDCLEILLLLEKEDLISRISY